MSEEAQVGTENPEEQPTVHEPEFDGEFDAEKAKRLVSNLRGDVDRYKVQVADLSEKARKLDDIEESKKSELEKLADKLSTAESRAQTAEANLLRYSVAAAKGVPSDAVDRLRGETEEELAADADKLLELLRPQPITGVPNASRRQGVSETPGLAADDPLTRDLKAKLGIT